MVFKCANCTPNKLIFTGSGEIKELKPVLRLTLIASDPRISSALVILSLSRMLLIYLNYRFWIRMWKDTYAKFLSDGLLDRKEIHVN